MANEDPVTFPLDEPVDFVIIGSGSAGGILAKELSTAGFSVVVLEQGPYRKATDFRHDELAVNYLGELEGGDHRANQQTFRNDASKVAEVRTTQPAYYSQGVGGSSVHFTANFWRLRELDFKERSMLGPISGTNFADWPISYAELEPYYTKVDWDIGLSGAPGPNDSFRSRPFPTPPMPIKSSGVLMERGAKVLGWNAQVEPLAILSRPHNGRPACINCGFCMGYGCEVGAKSSTLFAMIPLAEASGNCEIRAECAVFRIETNAQGRADEVLYYDPASRRSGQFEWIRGPQHDVEQSCECGGIVRAPIERFQGRSGHPSHSRFLRVGSGSRLLRWWWNGRTTVVSGSPDSICGRWWAAGPAEMGRGVQGKPRAQLYAQHGNILRRHIAGPGLE
jgi:choline dehydrogenase-like flavoprotein